MNHKLPLWASSLNEIAISLGGVETLVDLRPEALLRAAEFDCAPAYLELLTTSLMSEARLNAVGAIMARAELVRALKIRKRLEGGSADTNRASPLGSGTAFIIGMARSGTSFALRTLAKDKRFYAPKTFEVLMPETVGTTGTKKHTASATLQDELWNLLDPDFPAIHLNRGDLPAECLPIQSTSMLSHHWTGCYRVPSYETLVDADHSVEAFRIHRVFRDRLAAVHPTTMPLFKSPAYVRQLDSLIACYPDGKFVLFLRDLDEAVASHARLLTSIRSMRSSDSSVVDDSRKDSVNYFRHGAVRLMSLLSLGLLGPDNFRAISYRDVVESPRRTFDALTKWLLAEYRSAGTHIALAASTTEYARPEKGKENASAPIHVPNDLRLDYRRLVQSLHDLELFLII